MTGSATENRATAAFLADLAAVCRKHGLALGHEDTHGGFEVRPYSDALIEWLQAAADVTGGAAMRPSGTLDPAAPVLRQLGVRPMAVMGGPEELRFPDDVARLRRILNERGFDASDVLVERAYSQWSEDFWCAGWLILEDDDQALFEALMVFLAEVPEGPGEGVTRRMQPRFDALADRMASAYAPVPMLDGLTEIDAATAEVRAESRGRK